MFSHDDDATGPTDTITSPGSRPAAAAGVADVPDGHSPDGKASPAGSATVGVHGTTEFTAVVGAGIPIPTSTMPNSRNARTRFITGPPSMMITRLRTGSL